MRLEFLEYFFAGNIIKLCCCYTFKFEVVLEASNLDLLATTLLEFYSTLGDLDLLLKDYFVLLGLTCLLLGSPPKPTLEFSTAVELNYDFFFVTLEENELS